MLQIWLQSGITTNTERKDNREQHKEEVYVHRGPPSGDEYAVQYLTLGTWRNTVDQTVCHIAQYKYDGGSHGSNHLLYQQKGNFSSAAMVINGVLAGKGTIN